MLKQATFVIASILVADTASAASVEYDAYVGASITLESAVYAGTGADAPGYMFFLDLLNEDFVLNRTADVEALTSGRAHPWPYSDAAFKGFAEKKSTSSIELLDFMAGEIGCWVCENAAVRITLTISSFAHGGIIESEGRILGSLQGSATAGVGGYFVRSLIEDNPSASSQTVSFLLEPGETLPAYVYTTVDANISPTPVPLPASGLVLVTGLAAFCALRRSTRRQGTVGA